MRKQSKDSLSTFSGNQRFELIRKLGAGGMGIVHEAQDHERDIRVALKTLRRLDAGSLFRFKHEFRALADINHPNLVTLYELVSWDATWFFTMELLDGVDFLSFVRGLERVADEPCLSLSGTAAGATATATAIASVLATATATAFTNPTQQSASSSESGPTIRFEPADAARIRSVLPQLVDALDALHASGHLHRDIKPSNILVTDAGRVVVLDFGVITELATAWKRGKRENFAGTPAYMAPEQADADARPTPASDWYSVGIMLYAALTGVRPFTGSVGAMLKAKQSTEPPAPSTLQPDVDPVLEAITMGLLRRKPSQRQPAIEMLHELTGAATAAHAIGVDTRASEDLSIVGRDRQLAVLADAFAEVRSGAGLTVHVHGRSGMGKSTLVSHFVEQVRNQGGALVLSGRCYERESVPYEAIDSLVDALCQHLLGLPREHLDALMPSDVASLARAFPVLRRVPAIVDAQRSAAAVVSDPQELRKHVFAALRELLARLAGKQPLVLFIDDLQWGDLDSAGFLSGLMQPPVPHLLFMVAFRTEATQTSPLLKRLLTTPNQDPSNKGDVRELQVLRLSLPQSHHLASELLQAADLSDGAAEKIARESGGNPFFVHEFVRFLVSLGEDAAPETLTLEGMIEARVSVLSANAQALLQLVAVAAMPLPLDVARRATNIGEAYPLALAELSVAHMLRTSGIRAHDVVECFHDRIRETVATSLESSVRMATHLRVARGIESSDRPDAEALASHYAAAGERVAAYHHAIKAAEAASDALAFDRAASFYALSLDLLPDSDDQVRRSLNEKLGDSLVNAGRGADAATAYLNAAVNASEQEQLSLHVRAGSELLRSGYVDEGLDVLQPALAGAGLKLSKTPWRAMLSLVVRRMLIRMRGLRFRVRRAQELPPQTLARIDALWAASSAYAMADYLRGADIQTRHVMTALRAGDPIRAARALVFEAAQVCLAGPPSKKRTLKILEPVGEVAAETGDPLLQAMHKIAGALSSYQFAEWQPSIEFAEEAEAILRTRCSGATWELTSVQLYQLWSLYWQGRLRDLSTRTQEFLAEAHERGDVYSVVNLSTGIASVTGLLADDPQGTKERAEAARLQWSRQGYHLQHCWIHIALVQCDLYAGRGQAAHQVIEEQWRVLKSKFLLRILMLRAEVLHLRARCALAAATGDAREPMLRLAHRCARMLGRVSLPWCKPAAEMLHAAVHHQHGQTDKAIACLAAAEDGLAKADTHALSIVARLHRGTLMSDDAGQELAVTSSAWLVEQDVKSPLKFANFLAPGLQPA